MDWKALRQKIYKRLSGSRVGRNAPETGILLSFLQPIFMERSPWVQRWSVAGKQRACFHIVQRAYHPREDTHPWDVISHALVQSSASGSGQGPQSCLRCIRQWLCRSLQEGCPRAADMLYLLEQQVLSLPEHTSRASPLIVLIYCPAPDSSYPTPAPSPVPRKSLSIFES